MANVDFPLPIRRKKSITKIKCTDQKNEPVRPRIPTRSPAFKENDTSCSTAGSSGAYLMTRFSTARNGLLLLFSVFDDGQYAGARLDFITAGGSCGKSRLFLKEKKK